MATSIRLNEKTSWKTLKIPQDLFNTQDFSTLVEIQELTDYELVPETNLNNGTSSRSRVSNKRKRKIENLEETESVPLQDATPINKKKRKNRKMKKNLESNSSTVKQTVQSTTDTNNASQDIENISTKKKRKKNRTSNLPQTRESNCEDDMFIDDADGIIVIGDDSSELYNKSVDNTKAKSSTSNNIKTQSKKNKKSRGKVLSKINVGAEASNKANKAATGDSQNNRKKKRKRKKLKLKDIHKETTVDVTVGSGSSNDEEKENTTTKNAHLDMSQWKNLYVPDVLLQALQDEGFDTPTPIQIMALPSAIRDRRDILAAAETGSGKTLAFGIPAFTRILNSPTFEATNTDEMEVHDVEMESTGSDVEESDVKLESTVSHSPPLLLILEPTRELAVQVKNHLTALAKYTNIKIATIVGGMSIDKQRRILGKRPHVVIATPGRLWQLIEEGDEHLGQLDKVLSLVVDEADRMIEKGHYEELTKLFEMMNKSSRRVKNRQTFVMSATLTMDIGAPKRVMQKMKKHIVGEDKLKTLTERICIGTKPKIIDLTPKDKVAQTLTELRVNCKAEEKDFYLYYFLCRHPGRTLVFANSKDCLRRLVSLLTLLQQCPLPLHADMQQRQRLKNLERFAANSRGLLVASDVAARGLDIPNVDHVLHYQVPRTMENYVHRSGRTARASNLGLSVMLVGPEDSRGYRKIVHGVRNGEELNLLPVEMDLLPAVKQRVMLARDIDVKEYRIKKKRLRNNFFTKAAEEMDMIIDDTNLLADMGDLVEQAEDKQQLKQMKVQLTNLLRGSLTPYNMTKYPTKSGQLISAKKINLHDVKG